MFLADYHMHSEFSFDGSETIENMARAAMQKNISEIAITDHVELAGGLDCLWIQNEQKVFREIDKVRAGTGNLVIRKGMELGNTHLEPDQANKICREFNGDFIIGSVHNLVEGRDVWYYDFSNINCEEFFCEYLDAVMYVAEKSDYDVIGHITYPFKGIYQQKRYVPDFNKYKKQLQKIFEIVVNRGKGIEINTSGLRVDLRQTLPHRDILRLYRECGGTYITIGSDAHKAEEVGEGILQAVEEIRSLGYENITTYEKRKPIQYSIVKNAAGDCR